MHTDPLWTAPTGNLHRLERRWSRILLVEDDPEMRALLAEVLRDEGYAVEVANDGAGAARTLFANDSAIEDYDLVLCDVQMPGLDGVELATAVTRAFGPPVVLVSAFASARLAEDGVRAGALALVSKPFDLPGLVALVRDIAPPQP